MTPTHAFDIVACLYGTVAKWQGRALQKLDQRFESARCLSKTPLTLKPFTGLSFYPMIVGTLRVTLYLPENYSLKDKRQDVRSLLARTINQFHVAAAEVGDLDQWQRAIIGIACVSNNARHANEVLSKVVNFIEGNLAEGHMEDYEIEVIHLD